MGQSIDHKDPYVRTFRVYSSGRSITSGRQKDRVFRIGTDSNEWWASCEVIMLLTSVILLIITSFLLLSVFPHIQHHAEHQKNVTNIELEFQVYQITFSGDIASNRCTTTFESYKSLLYCCSENMTLKFSEHVGKFVGLHAGKLSLCLDTTFQNANMTFIFYFGAEMGQYSIIWIGPLKIHQSVANILIQGGNGDLVINELKPRGNNGVDVKGYDVMQAWVGKLYFTIDVIKKK